MSNEIYLWKIMAVDADAGTMVVEFTHQTKVTMLNLPAPDVGADLSEWIDKFAPRQQWEVKPVGLVTVGMEGEEFVVPATVAPPEGTEPPQVAGSFNEEYLRALIYQVLEEVQANTV